MGQIHHGYGDSSGVAVQLATARPVERLVLVTACDSLVNVAREGTRLVEPKRRFRRSAQRRS